MVKRVCLFVSLISFGLLVNAQTAKFRHYTKDDGLLSNTLQKIAQDSNGFLWIATNSGLNRFDGYTFKQYLSSDDTNSIPDNMVFDLLIDKRNRLFIATKSGPALYDPEQDNFSRKQFGTPYTKRIAVDKFFNVYFIHGGQLCSIWDTNYTLIGRINDGDDNVIPNFVPGSIDADNEGNIWLTTNTADGIVVRYDPTTGSAKYYRPDPYQEPTLYTHNVSGVFQDNEGAMWLYGQSGINTLDPVTGLVTSKSDLLYNHSRGFGYTINGIQDVKGKYWFMSGRTLSNYNPVEDVFKAYGTNELDVESMLEGRYLQVFSDHQENIWVLGDGCGLNLKYAEIKNFHHIKRIPGANNTLLNKRVNDIALAPDGRIWIATNGGVSVYNPNNGRFENFTQEGNNPMSLRSNLVHSLFVSRNGVIYVSAYGKGLTRWTGSGNNFIAYTDSTNFPNLDITNISEDSKGVLWMALPGKGILSFDPNTYEMHEFNYQQKDWRTGIDGFVGFVYVDNQDKIYTGANELTIIDPINEKVDRFNRDDFEGVRLGGLADYYIDRKGQHWLCLDRGLAKIDVQKRTLKLFSTEHGFMGTAAKSIIEDETGILWIGTNNGLAKFNPTSETIINYTKGDGLQDNEFDGASKLKGNNGYYFFGGMNGVTMFRPGEIGKNYTPPRMYLTGLKIFNDYVKIGKKSILKKDIKYQDRIRLKYKQNVITIEYVGINYYQPEKNTYKYMLEGNDRDWQEVGSARSAIYTKLQPGKYTFKVLGANSDGVWSEQPASIDIRVVPPFWRTKLFYLFVLVMIGFLIYRFFKWRELQAKRDKEVLEQKIEEGRKEIDAQKEEVVKQREEILRRDEAEKEVRFLHTGLAKFSEIISEHRRKLFKLTHNIISELVEYTGAKAGAIYLISDSDDEKVLMLTSSYAYKRKDDLTAIRAGEGYIGTCFQDKKTLTLENLPDGYVVLESGLGESRLDAIVLTPISNEDEVLGVIEIASFKRLDDYKIDFIEKIGASIGSTLSVARANKKAREMIQENKIQAEELMAQEEEMRQNIEELQATQEQAQRREEELVKELKEKKDHIASLQEEINILREDSSDN